MAYELTSLKLPKLTGMGLKAFALALENPVARAVLLGGLLENGGIPKLRRISLQEPPTLFPLVRPETPVSAANPAKAARFEAGLPPSDFPYRTLRDYANAYRQGDLTPLDAAERVLAAIDASEKDAPALRAFLAIDRNDVMEQARASAERLASGKPLSLLDGVPVAVKDEVDMKPYPTTVGTRFLGKAPAAEDSTVAARLRAAGALLIGKTNMHEIGINPNGFNANFGAVRNPFNPDCDPGGSSSGSAAAVSAGLVPMAIGADGGGSIRIPAALCGVVGLKPTFGRVSEAGAAPLCWTVAHLGPLAASVEDAAMAYSLVAGPDSRDPNSQVQPPLTLADWNRPDLEGVRLGIYRPWFEHAEQGVVQACWQMLERLKRLGAEVVEVTIPELDEVRIAHAITILSEMAICMRTYKAQRSQHGAAVRLSLVLGENLTAMDYLQAQRMRTRALGIFSEVFGQVDAIISPATAMAAQPIPAGGLEDGWSDLGTDTEMMRFIFPANLTGHPAISFPAGYTAAGLPVGMQAMGRHWDEHLLLRIAYNAERLLARRTPPRFYQIF
jgi:Asp-tRNA(Asn)/Glu-tRNA(Gln) amidotransferase A subunit family amidase